MNSRYLRLGIAAFAVSLGITACGNDVLVSEEHFTMVNSLNDEDCNDETEGSMAFVKSSTTMYVCSDGEWIAMSDEEAVKYRCSSKELADKSGFAIICDGDTIGVINNGRDGADGKDGVNGKDGANGENGTNGTNGTNGKDGDSGTNGSNGVSADTAAINKSIRDALSSASAKHQSDVNNALKNLSSASAKNQKDAEESLKNLSSASAKNQNDANSAIGAMSSASAKNRNDVNDAVGKLSSASAKNQQDVNDAVGKLSSASAKNQNDVGEALKNLSSATDKVGDDLNKKFNDAYSSYNAELKYRSCAITDTVRDYEKAIITVTIHCGDAETTMDLPFTIVNENLANVYKKHVVVRFPVQTAKETKSADIYEEIWKNLKGGENAELTVTDLDTNFDATGKLFVADLFADASKAQSFVTVEETNDKAVEYKIVRLEGDVDVTNMTTPVAQFRVKLNLTNPTEFSAFGGFGSTGTTVIYNSFVDLTDVDPDVQESSDTVVIDFLTDYKGARVKYLVKEKGEEFAEASKTANQELADALFLEKKGSNVYPTFETYLPNDMGLAENFNSVVWVMALIDQKSKTPGFNAVYNAYRDVFAEKGNFKTAVKTTYAGREQDMFFVDYIALMMDAKFVELECRTRECNNDFWYGDYAVYYKIVQDGFVQAYGLSTEGLVVYENINTSRKEKIFKSGVEGGYFRYFTYDEVSKIWWPLGLWAAAAATADKVKCDATTVGNTYLYSFEGLDDNAVCTCENDQCYWAYTDNECLGRNKGDIVYRRYNDDIHEFVCVEVDCSSPYAPPSCVPGGIVPVLGSSSSFMGYSSSSWEKNGKTLEEVANDGRFGACDETNVGQRTEELDGFEDFDLREAQLATTTGKGYFVCDGAKWRLETEEDFEYGFCTKSVMDEAVLRGGNQKYKCDYLDKEGKYSWVAVDYQLYQDLFNINVQTACHYGIADKNTFSDDFELICVTQKKRVAFEEDSLDVNGNHIYEWRLVTVNDYCVGDRVMRTSQKVRDEDLGNLTFDEMCKWGDDIYVRNSEGDDKEWFSVRDYYMWATYGINEHQMPLMINASPNRNASTPARIRGGANNDQFMVFLNGYTENKVYICDKKSACTESSIGAVMSAIPGASNSRSDLQKLINVICNMGEYKRVSAGAYAVDTIAFEVKVQLSEGEIKKTYVASAKRNDWHEATPADVFGECKEDKMKSQSSLSVYDGTNYKCDYIESNGSSYYTWREASELDANATLGICTYAHNGDYAKNSDKYYNCTSIEDPNTSSSSWSWIEVSESEYIKGIYGECNADNETKSFRDIKTTYGYYKCSVRGNDAKWVDAYMDDVVGVICNADKAEGDKFEDISSSSYVCVDDGENSFYQWKTATLEERYGECNASSQTQSINSLVYFEFNYYKCDCIGETCKWSSANDDERLGKLCSHNNSGDEIESDQDNQSYVCSLDGASSSYSWSAP
ncbi:hypothetical protein [Fibrobacter sp.]|uniref:hypothetical protein n=1 Tax=Fibrobacter sp. TaxID=35828 RepID=UPI0038656E8D